MSVIKQRPFCITSTELNILKQREVRSLNPQWEITLPAFPYLWNKYLNMLSATNKNTFELPVNLMGTELCPLGNGKQFISVKIVGHAVSSPKWVHGQ